MRFLGWENIGYLGDGIGSDHSGYGHTFLNLEPFLGIIPQYYRDSVAAIGKGGVYSLHIYPQRREGDLFSNP